ncbi:hypothetical protein LUQ84_002632 [Hamiltosporidium tvaerminnensis]|nr:hypothetical protein LUQ84_002632 [Hamiltosporidium tvaerminnensis]
MSVTIVVCVVDRSIERKLNSKYTRVKIKTDTESYANNQLFFIDDLKLFAEDVQKVEVDTEEVTKFIKKGLEINKEMSATNVQCDEFTATLLEGLCVYKHL